MTPRAPLLHAERLSEEAKSAYQASYEAFGKGTVLKGVVDATTSLPSLAAVLLHNPGVYRGFMQCSEALLRHSGIPARDREIVTLRIAWLCQAPVAWSNHTGHAHDLGMSPKDVEQVTVGPDGEGWSPREKALLRMADELHQSATVSDAVWDELSEHFEVSQLVCLPLLVGLYHEISFIFNMLRVPPPDPERGGMDAR
jgi:alkylhydroperoxidase family enzyme